MFDSHKSNVNFSFTQCSGSLCQCYGWTFHSYDVTSQVLVPQSRPFLTFCKVTCSKSLNKSASLKPTLTEPSHEYPNWIGVMFMVTLKSRDLSFLGESV